MIRRGETRTVTSKLVIKAWVTRVEVKHVDGTFKMVSSILSKPRKNADIHGFNVCAYCLGRIIGQDEEEVLAAELDAESKPTGIYYHFHASCLFNSEKEANAE